MSKMKLNIQYFAGATINGSWTKSGNGSGTCDCRIVWSSTKNDSANTSSVTASVQVMKEGSSSTTCTFEGTITIDGTSYSVSKYDSWAWGEWHTIGTKKKTVTHNADGTKSITIKSTIKTADGTTSMSGTYSASGTAKLDTINRASKLGEIDNFNIDETISIPITKYATTFTDNLVISYGDTTIKSISGITDGYSLTFTSAEQTAIKSLMTSPQIKLTYTLTTLNGSTQLGTSTQTALVTSLDQSVFRHVLHKENGKYQTAFNGLVDTANEAPIQAYDDNGIDILKRIPVTLTGLPSGSSYGCYYYPLLNMCFLRIYLTGKAYATGTRHTIATVEEGYRPNSRTALTVDGLQDYAGVYKCSITNTGEIGLITSVAKESGDDNYIVGFWFVD